jgi:hypothetical protein
MMGIKFANRHALLVLRAAQLALANFPGGQTRPQDGLLVPPSIPTDSYFQKKYHPFGWYFFWS